MADTTISQLQSLVATGNTIVPVSLGETTYQTSVSSIVDTIGSRTSSLALPLGTTAQRNSSPINGSIRYNSTTNNPEMYINGEWKVLASYSTNTFEVLVVAGGGGGGNGSTSPGYGRGGGGAGGLLYNNALSLTTNTFYTINFGAGGS